MPSKITIIEGHPDSSRRHLCHALADAYADAAAQAGHSVSCVGIAGIEFPLLRTQEQFNPGAPPASLKPAVDAIVAADHLVLIFPLWLGTMPALVKAFLEQVMLPGVAFGIRGLRRSVFKFVGFSPVRTTMFGMTANASDATKSRWFDIMRKNAAKAR
jgi:putative NADPH-quinone reductase